LLLFDGNRGHSVESFKGERFSLVYFCTRQHFKANAKVQSDLKRAGITLPTKEGLAHSKTMLGKPRGYKALAKNPALKKSTKPICARVWPQKQYAKHSGVDFCSKAMQEKAKARVGKIGSLGLPTKKTCTDTKFVSWRYSYQMLPDKRRRFTVYMKGVSGGERIAVIGDEEKVGAGRYLYKKVKDFPLGSALDTVHLSKVRAWCSNLVPKMDQRAGRQKYVTKSYSKTESSKRKRSSSSRLLMAKKARTGGA